jgi:uncharacterized protein (TIGR02266 family)
LNPPQNRRQFPRLILEAEVDLQSGSNFFAGRTRDISLGGLFIETELPLGVGARVDVSLALAGSPVILSCEVAWTLFDASDRPVGLGLHFLSLGAETRVKIVDFMRSRAPIGFEHEPHEMHEPTRRAGPPPLPLVASGSAPEGAGS